jgi:hypothetical protein
LLVAAGDNPERLRSEAPSTHWTSHPNPGVMRPSDHGVRPCGASWSRHFSPASARSESSIKPSRSESAPHPESAHDLQFLGSCEAPTAGTVSETRRH